jgi:O-antigen/teichoic acid export membrane protein
VTGPGGGAARGGIQLVLARGGFYAVAYLAAVLLARGLGPVEYGVYGVVISVLVWLEQVAQAGLTPAAARLIPEGDADGRLAGTTLALSGALFTLLFVTTWLAAPSIARALGLDDGGLLLRVAALDLPVFGLYVGSRGVCQGHRRFLALAVAEWVYVGCKAAGLLALLLLGFSVVAALLVNVAASVGGVLVLLPRVVPLVRRAGLTAARRLLPLAARFAAFMLALQTLGGLDLWMLTPYVADTDSAGLGAYVAARTVAAIPSLVLVAVSEVLLPSLSRALADGDTARARRYLESAVRFLWIVLAPITALVFLTGEELMTLLFSERYAPGGAWLGLLTAGSALFALVFVLGSALGAAGRAATAVAVPLGAAAVDIGLNLALIPLYGPAGAAAARLVTAVVAVGAMGLLAYRRFGGLVRARTLAVASLAAVVVLLAAAPVKVSGLLLLAYFGAALALYTGLLVVLRELRAAELAVVWAGLGPLAPGRSRT